VCLLEQQHSVFRGPYKIKFYLDIQKCDSDAKHGMRIVGQNVVTQVT